jgi:eukaryotic-like serine/threonine-protein kinase
MSDSLSPTRLQRVRQLFEDALDRDPTTRDAFLTEATAGDEDLRREVESLLHALEQGGDSLESAASDMLASALREADDGTSLVGQRIGAYDIVRLIGYGGMGAVYEGLRADEQFEKRVAIKMLRRGVEGDLAIRRFRYERQILASLNHRNIAALLDGGVTPDGQPYIVMEYVEGQPITRYCDARRLSVQGRVALFRQVCAAVQHAHQNLVVHRDLKPGNILVDTDGTVKLLDFGIAKLLREEEGPEQLPLTHGGTRAFTPEYASPEQVRWLPMSTASDVYSLGLVLFELLTGTRPFRFEHKLLSEIEKTICEEEAPRPSSVVPDEKADALGERRATRVRAQLVGDLDAIILKAVRKEPARRYGSAEQLAADLRRHLEGQPVSAQRDWYGYRVGKYLRRHRWEVAASLLFVASLVGGIIATSRQARRAESERAKAEQINAFLTSMLSSVNPENAGRDVTVRQVLDSAVRRIDSSLVQAPEVQSSVRETIGRTYLALGNYEEAERQLRRTLETRRALLGESHPEVARTVSGIALVLENAGRLDSAEVLWRQALDLRRRTVREDDAETASLLDGIARMRERQGDLQTSEQLHREVLALRKRLLGDVHVDVAHSLNNLAVAVGQQGKYAESEQLQREAVRVTKAVFGAEHPIVASAMSPLASVLEFQKKFGEADSIYREVLAMRKKLLGNEHPDYAWTLFNYTYLLVDRKRYGEAASAAREVLSLRGKTLPEGHPAIASSLQSLGRSLDRMGDLDGGGKALEESLALRRQSLPAGHWLIVAAQNALGEHQVFAKRYAAAEALLLPSYEKLLELRGPKASVVQDAMARLVALYEAWGKPAEAAKWRAKLSAGATAS